MGKAAKALIVVAVVAAAAGVIVLTRRGGQTATEQEATPPPSGEAGLDRDLPRLVDLGRGKCVACKAMKPVLEALTRDYAGKLVVQVIDLNDDPDAAEMFDIKLIPTQIFYDAAGEELWRHEGFLARDAVVAKWRELGVDLGPPAGAASGGGALARAFAALSRALEGTPAIALAAAFVWGVLSVVLSPCHLASIPLIVGFIDQQGRMTTRRAFAIASLFALGILITIGVIGAATAAAGRLAGDLGPAANYAVALVFFVVGLHLLDVLPMPWSGPGQVGMKRKGLLAAFVLGLVFGIALGPCTFAYMAPLLGVTFRLGAERFAYAALLLLTYGVGHCSVIVFAGTFAEVVQRYLNWDERSKGTVISKRICGILVVLGGLYTIYVAA